MVVSNNVVISKIFTGDILVQSGAKLTILGIVNGNITVESGAFLIVTGIVNENITINIDADVTINGIVNGIVTNHGKLTVFGILNKLNNYSNNLEIKPKAIIDGKEY